MKKIKVVIASVLAGSGHNSAAELMAQLLSKDERFEVVRYTNPTRFLDSGYNLMTKYTPAFHNIFVNHSPFVTSDLLTLGQIGFVTDAIKIIKKEKPDIILSTHFMMAHAFKVAEWITGRYSINVCTYLDYGKQASGMIPYNIFLRPEYAIVYDEETRQSFAGITHIRPKFLILGGHACRDEFEQARLDFKTKAAARKQLLQEYPGLPFLQPGINKTNVLIAGGGGGIIQKTFKLLKAIAARQKEDLPLIDKYQFFVICGENKKYFKKIMKVRSTKLSWQNIFPFGWLDARKYALIQRAADFPVTFGIAPATMHELLETECGPLIMHRVRADHEYENVEFVVRKKLGKFEPETEKVVNMIFKPLTPVKKAGFEKRATELLAAELQRFLALPDVLAGTMAGNLPRSEDVYPVSWGQKIISGGAVLFTWFFYYITIMLIWLQQLFKKLRRVLF